MTFKEGGAFDFATAYERLKETITQAVEVARESGGQQGAPDLSDINLEQLPAYEDIGSTTAVSAAPHPPIQQPTPITPAAAPSFTPQSDSRSTVSSAGGDQSHSWRPEQQQTPPDEPPPGYEEAQQQNSHSVVDNLERNLRISK